MTSPFVASLTAARRSRHVARSCGHERVGTNSAIEVRQSCGRDVRSMSKIFLVFASSLCIDFFKKKTKKKKTFFSLFYFLSTKKLKRQLHQDGLSHPPYTPRILRQLSVNSHQKRLGGRWDAKKWSQKGNCKVGEGTRARRRKTKENLQGLCFFSPLYSKTKKSNRNNEIQIPPHDARARGSQKNKNEQ